MKKYGRTATKRRAWVPHQDDSGPHVGRCHCLGRLGMMAMAAVWYADLGRCGLSSQSYKVYRPRGRILWPLPFLIPLRDAPTTWHTLILKRVLTWRLRSMTARMKILKRGKERGLIVLMRMRSLAMRNRGRLSIVLTGGWSSFLGMSRGYHLIRSPDVMLTGALQG